MTLWHDQTTRRERSQTLEDRDRATIETEQEAQPGSRRAARERERRAAEALAAGQQHPSGVVDFGDNDLHPDFDAEAGLAAAATTTDIWEALSRPSAQQAPVQAAPSRAASAQAVPAQAAPEQAAPAQTAPAPTDRRSARRAAEAAEQQARDQASAMPEGLMERVRERVLQEHSASAEAPMPAPAKPLTRRQIRQQQAAEVVDGMPAAWFSEAGPTATPAGATGADAEIPEAFIGHEEIPTVRMPAVDRAMLEARLPMTGPVDLPQYFSDPVGDDELAFSDPVLPELAQPRSQHPAAAAAAEFLPPAIEPMQPWAGNEAAESTPMRSWLQPTAEPTESWEEIDADPERTDLAGFEALITRSRGALAPDTGLVQQQPARHQPEGDEDPHAGFSGLLSRNVATPHGSQNALIMPSDPQPDLTKAVTGTGEQFITGSMKLSRSLAATGGTAAQYDSLEVDRLFEAPEEPASNVTPVRAVRAVSGGASTHDVRPRRSRSSALPVVLAIVAGVMAVGVLTLLVGSWAFGAFSLGH